MVTIVATAGLLAVALAAAVPAQATTTTNTRIVSGTAPVTDSTGLVWRPDAPYVAGGQLSTTTHAIKGTDNPKLYQTERYGQSGYHIPVTGQTDVVTLRFAEQTWTAPGQRVFGVLAEGQQVRAGVDIEAAVGPFTAYRISFTVAVTDGVLDLGFVDHVGLPSVTSLDVKSSGKPSPVAGAPTITPESFGAKGDGHTDDSVALQRAFDSAPVGTAVVLAAGHAYAHSAVLHLRTPGLHVTGAGTLLATAEQTSSVWIEADNVLLDGGVTLKTATTTARWSAWEQMGLRIVGHTGVTVRDVTVVGSAAAGVYVGGAASNFVLDHVTVENTRADGIHITEGSHDGQVLSPVVRNSGDDGVAVVSYQQDGAACANITVTSPTVLGTTWGRGLSVVGGRNITETDVDVRDTSAAGIYLASEGSPWFATATSNVLISGGSVTGANTDTTVDHGAVLVLSGETDVVPSHVTVQGLTISGTRTTASRNLGVITYGAVPNTILFSAIAITGGPAAAYQGNTPTSAYRLVGVTHNGVAVPVTG